MKKKLSVLGSDGVLDTLIYVKNNDWTTASELAAGMRIHVATAVKRLTMLHGAGFLNRRVRKGRTRHADEYTTKSAKIVIEIDLDDGGGSPAGSGKFLGALVRDIMARLGRFCGGGEENVLDRWQKIPEIDDKMIAWLKNDDEDNEPDRILGALLAILDAEAAEYGELTVRALARASLDAVRAELGPVGHELPSRYFGGE